MEASTIVLTGTITPRAPFTAYADADARRAEYLAALQFYSQFAPVVFLENSGYALRQDAAFAGLANCSLIEMPLSAQPERGKGYQEFEMLDGWLQQAPQPPAAFFKITGRYRYANFAALLRDGVKQRTTPLVMDLHPRSARAMTSLFWVETGFYQTVLQGLYRACDDERGAWIERVVYQSLPAACSRAFGVEPCLRGRSGSTSGDLADADWKHFVKSVCRKMNLALDARRLWYVR